MATIIDSLIVTLGLDPSGFTKGQKAAAEAIVKTKVLAEQAGKDMEASGKKASEFFSQLRGQVLLLFAAFAGGKGIKQFASDVVSSDAALGRMAAIIGTTTQKLSEWRGMATSMGGSADGVTDAINGFNQALVDVSLTGESSILPILRALQAFAPGVDLSLTNTAGKLKTAADLLPQIHAAVQGMDKATAFNMINRMGLGPLANQLMTSDAEFKKMMADQERWGRVTGAQAKAMAGLQYGLSGVTQSFTTLGRILLTQLAPALERVMKWLTDLFVWFQSHPKEMEQAIGWITAGVLALAVALGGPITVITALGVAFGILYNDWNTWNTTGQSRFAEFWQAVTDGWGKIRTAAQDVSDWMRATFGPLIDWFVTEFKDGFDSVTAAVKVLYDVFFGTSEDLKRDWRSMMDSFEKFWVDLWLGLPNAILAAGPAIMAAIRKAVGAALGWAVDRANVIWNAITGHDLIDKRSGEEHVSQEAKDKAAAAIASGGSGGGIGAAAAGMQGSMRVQDDMKQLMALGASREEAAAIMAQALHESTNNDRMQVIDSDKRLHRGLMSWSPDRVKDFESWAHKPFDDSTHQEQVAFAYHELHGGKESGVGMKLRPGMSAGTMAKIISSESIRPLDKATNEIVRAKTAEGLMHPPEPPHAVAAAVTNAMRRLPPGYLQSAPGAPSAAVQGNPANDNRSTSTATTNIQTLNVNTPADKADGIAKDIKGAIDSRFTANQANTGQT